MLNGIFFKTPIEKNFIGHIMAEIYKDKVYDPYLSGRKDLTILDIGANIGLTAYYFSQFGTVYAMEPSLEHFEVLTEMINFNKLKNVKAFRSALYIENKTFTLFHNPNRTMYSLHMAVADPKLGNEPVNTVTLDKFLDDNKIKHVDFMKLDIEGSEAEVFASKGFRSVANRIDTLMFENHTWNGRNPQQIKDSLTSLGFKLEQMQSDANIWVAQR